MFKNTVKFVVVIIMIVVGIFAVNEIGAHARYAEFMSRVDRVEYIENPAVKDYHWRYHMKAGYGMNTREFMNYKDFYLF